MKTVFFGTPEVAVPFLARLAEETQVVAVVSQPDKPAGRKLEIAPTPVKKKALELGLKVFQPNKPSEIAAELEALAPDLAVAVAYGRILKPDVLAIPKRGALNVHFSLLPAYRGAAPVQWALAKGETKSGVTVFKLDEGMDTGPILVQKEIAVSEDDDAAALFEKMRLPSLAALSEALALAKRGETAGIPQSGPFSLAPLIKREDALLSFDMSAQEMHNRVRAFCLWPKAYLQGKTRLIVLKTRLEPQPGDAPIGKIVSVAPSGAVLVQCSSSSRLWFLSVQPEGKKAVSAAEFLNGQRLKAGDLFSI